MFSNSSIHRSTDSPINGFTLIELIIVITIIGIIALFATIDTGWFQRDARVTEARDRLLANLEDLKLKSLTRYPHGIIVPNTTNAASYRLVKLFGVAGADFKRDNPADDSSIENLPAAPDNPVILPTNIRVELTGGSTEIWFDRKGMPRTGTWTVLSRTLYIWYDANGDGVRDANEITKRIDVENGGKIQYEK